MYKLKLLIYFIFMKIYDIEYTFFFFFFYIQGENSFFLVARIENCFVGERK